MPEEPFLDGDDYELPAVIPVVERINNREAELLQLNLTKGERKTGVKRRSCFPVPSESKRNGQVQERLQPLLSLKRAQKKIEQT